MFKSGDRTEHFYLHILRERRGKALEVYLVGVLAEGFGKQLVPRLVGEPDDLVLDARTVAGTCALYHPGIKRRAVKIVFYYFMRRLIGVGNVAGYLRYRIQRRLVGVP